jgi:hypothetical protein
MGRHPKPVTKAAARAAKNWRPGVRYVCGFDGSSFRAMMGPAARAQNAPASRQLFNPI